MVHFSPMKKEHIPFLLELERLCFSVPWSSYTLKALLQDPHSLFLVAHLDDTLVGYGGIHWVLDEGNLDNMAIHPDFQGQGYGPKLLEEISTQCKKLNLVLLMLEVRESNHTAIRMYQKAGFYTVGRRENYYTSPSEAALLMNMDLQ